jgi:pumilio family protein 6
VETVGKEVCVAICTAGETSGCFVIAELCEALKGGEGEGEGSRETLKGWFGPAVVKKIEAGEAKGKTILLEKIAAL